VASVEPPAAPSASQASTADASPVGDPLAPFGAVVGGKGQIRLREGTVRVSAGLPEEVVRRIVRNWFGRFRLCYAGGLRKDPMLEGRVTIKFVIAPSGSVSGVRVARR
jgi:hypothetical protein